MKKVRSSVVRVQGDQKLFMDATSQQARRDKQKEHSHILPFRKSKQRKIILYNQYIHLLF